MKIKLYLNKTYLYTCDLINAELDIKKFTIRKNNEGNVYITIDGITFVDNEKIINSLEFAHYGYTSLIEINNKKIYSSNFEYKKKLYFKNFIDFINFIKEI